MFDKIQAVRTAFMLCGAVMLSGCGSDPASEAPVSLKAGQYSVTLSGNTSGLAGMAPGAGKPVTETGMCIREGFDEGNVASLAKQNLALGTDCDHSANERVGNAVSGTVTCPLGPDVPGMGGSAVSTYTGAIGAESITLTGTMKMELSPAMRAKVGGDMSDAEIEQGLDQMEDIVLTVKAERTGDCS